MALIVQRHLPNVWYVTNVLNVIPSLEIAKLKPTFFTSMFAY